MKFSEWKKTEEAKAVAEELLFETNDFAEYMMRPWTPEEYEIFMRLSSK